MLRRWTESSKRVVPNVLQCDVHACVQNYLWRRFGEWCFTRCVYWCFRDLKSFKSNGTIGSWIKTIVIRKATKQVRFENRFERFEEKHDVGISYQTFSSRLLEREISALPEGYRTVFTLSEIEGYKHAEIASMLNISVSTSRTQLFHAKRTLRERLKNERDNY